MLVPFCIVNFVSVALVGAGWMQILVALGCCHCELVGDVLTVSVFAVISHLAFFKHLYALAYQIHLRGAWALIPRCALFLVAIVGVRSVEIYRRRHLEEEEPSKRGQAANEEQAQARKAFFPNMEGSGQGGPQNSERSHRVGDGDLFSTPYTLSHLLAPVLESHPTPTSLTSNQTQKPGQQKNPNDDGRLRLL